MNLSTSGQDRACARCYILAIYRGMLSYEDLLYITNSNKYNQYHPMLFTHGEFSFCHSQRLHEPRHPKVMVHFPSFSHPKPRVLTSLTSDSFVFYLWPAALTARRETAAISLFLSGEALGKRPYFKHCSIFLEKKHAMIYPYSILIQ